MIPEKTGRFVILAEAGISDKLDPRVKPEDDVDKDEVTSFLKGITGVTICAEISGGQMDSVEKVRIKNEEIIRKIVLVINFITQVYQLLFENTNIN